MLIHVKIRYLAFNVTFVSKNFQPLVVTVGGVTTVISKYNGSRRISEKKGDGVEVVNSFDFWDEGSGGGLDAARQFTQHPAGHVEVMYQAVVEDTT